MPNTCSDFEDYEDKGKDKYKDEDKGKDKYKDVTIGAVSGGTGGGSGDAGVVQLDNY